MEVVLSKKFNKDLGKIRDKKIQKSIKQITQNIEFAKNIYEIQGVLKLKGTKNLYRIKTSSLGKYRIVFSYENDEITLILMRVLHRKEIYEKID